MTKVEAGKAREVEERERRRGEWRSIRGLFKLNTTPPLVDTFKVSLLDTTLIKCHKKWSGMSETDNTLKIPGQKLPPGPENGVVASLPF